MTLPAVYGAAASDVHAAVDRVRTRVKALAEPRLYQTAVMLTVLLHSHKATGWLSWSSPPPSTALRFGKADFKWAMWLLFGTDAAAFLRPGSTADLALGQPKRVMLDVLYDGQRTPLTLVTEAAIAPHQMKNSIKVGISDPSWVWSAAGAIGSSVAAPAEYNPVNSMNQQNGIGCAWTAAAAYGAAGGPQAVYATPRSLCPNRRVVASQEPTCAINDAVCGGQGDGAERKVTKPRLLAPPVAGSESLLVLPGTVASLVGQATRNGASLPAAADLSLIASWCHTNGSGTQDATRLPQLLGPDGLRLLTSTT